MSATPPPPPPPAAPPPPPSGTPAAAPGAQPKKKGIGTLGWIAIGCGGILLVAALFGALTLGWLFNKGKEVVRDFDEDPAMAAAVALVRLNPEIELVESDPEARTVTIREKESGKVMTVSLADLQEGRIGFESEEGKGSVEFGGEKGVFRVESSTGESFEIGQGEIPAWVPTYPGLSAQPTVLFSTRSGTSAQGAFSFETEDEPSAVLDHYVSELEAAGFTVERSDVSSSFGRGGQVNARLDAEGRRVDVNVMTAGDEGTTRGTVNYQEDAG